MTKLSNLQRILMFVLPPCMVALSGCDDASTFTFLDLVQTVLLGITAAGGVVLIRQS